MYHLHAVNYQYIDNIIKDNSFNYKSKDKLWEYIRRITNADNEEDLIKAYYEFRGYIELLREYNPQTILLTHMLDIELSIIKNQILHNL